MNDMPMGQSAAGKSMHMAKRKVTKVDLAVNLATYSHDPAKSLNWPAMAMGFQVKDKMLLGKLAGGKKVAFEFTHADKGDVITALK